MVAWNKHNHACVQMTVRFEFPETLVIVDWNTVRTVPKKCTILRDKTKSVTKHEAETAKWIFRVQAKFPIVGNRIVPWRCIAIFTINIAYHYRNASRIRIIVHSNIRWVTVP